MQRHAVVVGGGVAGMATALHLADQGASVTLVERRPFLGGRAFSFDDAVLGTTLDNGQHAMLGCYRETLALLARIGSLDRLRWQEREWIEVRAPGERGRFGPGSTRAPFHLLSALLGYRLLSRREQIQAMLGAMRLIAGARRDPRWLEGSTVEEALVSAGQSARIRERLWYPLAIAALNEEPARACAALFAAVISRAFFGGRRDAAIVLPAVPLSHLFAEPAQRALRDAGVHLLLGETAVAVDLSSGNGRDLVASGVRLRDGRSIPADVLVLALTPRQIAGLDIGGRDASSVLGRWLDRLQGTVPIVSTHVPLEVPVSLPDVVGLLGTTTQWVFNADRIVRNGSQRRESGGRLSCVTSGARQLDDWDDRRIAEHAADELERHVPEARGIDRPRIRVVRERHATMAPSIEAHAARPSTTTVVRRLFLAGDWVQTGLPATIESAALSAKLAARAVAASCV